jgi:3-methylfumaryl-CoA hydratase
MSALDIEDLRSKIGRERLSLDDLHPYRAQAFAAALDRTELPQPGDPLPPSWQWLYFLDIPRASDTGADGHLKVGEFPAPAALPRRMWAAGNFSVKQPLRLGQVAEQRSRVISVDLKQGKSGALAFVNVERRTSQGGQICLVEEQNLVYRPMPDGFSPLPPGELAPASAEADWTQTITPDPVLLFRYSALTYNGHRIHYDRNYATQREHYPALVVHGPLLASLLIELLATRLPGVPLIDFRFRAQRPTFDTHSFMVCGKRDGSAVRLWTADHEGYVGMTATATLGAA